MFGLKTFGGLSLADDAGPRTGHATRRSSLALLVLLAAARERGVTRDKLLGYLWPERDDEKARHALAQALYELRRELGKDAVLLRASDLRLNPERVTSDVAAFEDALTRGDGARALALYRGPFLDGFFLSGTREFERWVEGERARLARRAVEACEALATAAATRGDHRAAVSWWNRLLELDPLDSRAALGLMRALVAAGDRAGALAAARAHESVLRAELEVGPEDAVRALADELRTGAPPAPRRPSPDKSRVLWPTWVDRERPWRRRVVTAVVSAGVVAAVAVAAWRRATLDPNLLAVVPFNVLEPSLELWREGMVDLLSRNIDGAGPLRTVSPTVIVHRWKGSADRSSSAQLARHVGARLVIFGTLVRSGADSVRVEATLLDAGPMRVLAEAQLRDQAQHMDRLSDSLTLTLLRELGPGQPIRGVQLAGFGRTSLPALKAFLRGEQHYRRAEMDSARTYYERAVALDSTFAVAYQRLGRVAAWRSYQGDSLSRVYALRAGALNRGIAPRESLLIAADSLYAALEQWEEDPALWSHVTRQMQTLELAARRYPDDPEVWNDLGEARVHYGPYLGVTAEQALAALAQAIALDSAFGLPYSHAVALALNLDGPGAARNYVRRYLATNPAGEFALEMRIVERLLDPQSTATLALDQLLDTIPTHAVWGVSLYLEGWPDSAETAVRVARLHARRDRFADIRLCRMLLLRGHVREATPCATEQHARLGSGLYTEVALLGAVPPESARVTLEGDLDKVGRMFPSWPGRAVLWAVIDDTALLQEVVRRGDSTLRAATKPALRRIAQVKTYSARAYLALARHDTTDALRQFLSMPDSLEPWKALEDLTTAQLLAARGRDRDALRLLRVLQPFPSGRTVLSALERGRIAERLGERREAAGAYQYVADMWMHADPELQPHVREAHVALARLRAGR